MDNSPAWNYEIKGNNRTNDSKITGQYVQKELILDIASWISPEIEQKCKKFMQKYELQDEKDLDIFEFVAQKKLPIANDINK
ncbi:MAG: KilA-N domain-containing protein, partial [Cetobacterium sp.]